MITYGYAKVDVEVDLRIAARLGAKVIEVLPDWRNRPDPRILRERIDDSDLKIHSVHGCWGGQAIRSYRVDIAHTEPSARRASVDDVRRCADWLDAVGGHCLVVHPGGLSDPSDAGPRRAALAESLASLADHAAGRPLCVCVENMPPGVFPGSRMVDLRHLLEDLDRPELGLAVDTGHANLSATAAEETLEAGPWLRTTHVHDNFGRADTHEPPGTGTIDWSAWVDALDAVGYEGPIILECIRHFRTDPVSLGPALADLLDQICGRPFDRGKG
jgi:sugar phosphate isomerase/epimerase